MRNRILIVIGVTGFSILLTAYIFGSGGNDPGSTASAREAGLQQEIDRLQQVIANLNAALARIDSRFANTPAAVNTAPPKRSVAQAAAPPASPPTVTSDESPPTPGASSRPRMIIVNPTPEQNARYESLKQRFDDPSFVKTLNLSELSQMEEMKGLPGPMQQMILSQAMERYNRGEVADKKAFFSIPGASHAP
jgi:hypothetical protein